MKITPDTNLLVRVLVQDDAKQAARAERELMDAEAVVFTTEALCELVWVLSSRYRYGKMEIAAGIRVLIDAETAVADHAAVNAGLNALENGADFADAVIAHMGRDKGGEVFVSFDRNAVRRVSRGGYPARVPH